MGLKAFWAEFKAFAFKGNMIDLAVAVVIGAAFSQVINALVADIIMPGISYVTTAASTASSVAAGKAREAGNALGVTSTQPATQPATAPAAAPAAPPPAPTAAPAPASPTDQKAISFDWMAGRFKIGDFIGSLINFVLIALAVFVTIVKLLGSVMKRVGPKDSPTEPVTKECPMCLSIIPIKARKCSHCTADLPEPAPAG